MSMQPERPQSIGGVLDTAFHLYKATVGKVWPLCALLVVAGSPPSIYMLKHRSAEAGVLGGFEMGLTYWLLYVVTLTLTLAVVAALYLQQHALGVGQSLSTSQALRQALDRLAPLVLMTILFVIAVGIGLALLLVPGMILMVSLMPSALLLLIEGKSPVASLKGSHALVWGDWGRTAAILSVGFIIVMVAYAAIGLVVAVAAPFVLIGNEDPLMAALMAGLLIGGLVTFIVTPFYGALLIAIYWDLKLRKRGEDLASRIDGLTAHGTSA